MQGYFSYLPNINYVSRSTDRSSNDEFIQVKNIFRRAKIRDDMLNIVTGFDDYTIGVMEGQNKWHKSYMEILDLIGLY